MSRAAVRGHEVLFVETGGFLGKHLWRLRRRTRRSSLARRLFATEAVGTRISAVKALNVLPWGQKYGLANAINSVITARRLRRLTRRLPHPVVAWIYDPCAAPIAARLDVAFPVYDCVDDYAEQVGSSQRRRTLVAQGDARAAAESRLVFTTTKSLFARQSERNMRTHLVPNVGDFTHFSTAVDRGSAAEDVACLVRPVFGFADNMLVTKVDFALLESLARARPKATLLLVGPERSESRPHLRRLSALPNVHWVGARSYEEIPRYVAAFDVGLIPYLENDYTRSCFPLKLYEYLAAGKPVVASGLPELMGMEPDVVVTRGSGGFLAAVDEALSSSGSEAQTRRMAPAAKNTWETRTEQLLGLVAAELSG